MAQSKIEWTDSVWNVVTGCSHAGSPGCDHCYAKAMARRLAGRFGYPKDQPFKVTYHKDRLREPLGWRKARKVFVCSMGDLFHSEVEDWQLDEIFGVVLACRVFENLPRHTFMTLTKRPERMLSYLSEKPGVLLQRWSRAVDGLAVPDTEMKFSELVDSICSARWDARGRALTELRTWSHPENLFPLRNVIAMTTIENQEQADRRVPLLLRTPAVARGVSVEPILGPINLRHIDVERHHPEWCFIDALTGKHTDMGRPCPDVPKLEWVICGGETGPGARPMHPEWVRSLRDQCQEAQVPFFFKSWGEWAAFGQQLADGHRIDHSAACHGAALGTHRIGPDGDDGMPTGKAYRLRSICFDTFYQVGKKAAGHLLDGQEWQQFPEVR